jgi:hypothetical protein
MRVAIPLLHQYVLMAWCLVKHGDNFTFTKFGEIIFNLEKVMVDRPYVRILATLTTFVQFRQFYYYTNPNFEPSCYILGHQICIKRFQHRLCFVFYCG